MFKIDLHTHSTASPDGGITEQQYMSILEDNTLDYIAITDHGTVEFAKSMHKILGDRVIIGEEIMTREGEVIGLYLKHSIKPGLSARETMLEIKKQKGVVYVPHPLETVRSGLAMETLEACIDLIDIIESYNGRAVLQNKGPKVTTWARLNQIPVAAASDAHGVKGVGMAYTSTKEPPMQSTLPGQINLGRLTMNRPPLRTLLYPKLHKIKQKIRGRR